MSTFNRGGDIPLFDLGKELGTDMGGAPGMTPLQSAGMPGLTGPGTQPDSDGLNYLQMPTGMSTFDIPLLPESDELAQFPEVSELLDRLQQAQETRAKDVAGDAIVLPLNELSAQACSLLYQTLGEGEVMLRVKQPDGGVLAIQESVLAGVWWIQNQNADGSLASQWLEVAAIPACVLTDSFASASVPDMPEVPAGLLNAAPVLLELLDKATAHTEQAFEQPHVINLSLLPFSPEDHAFLHEILRFGPTSILSRGYGNCRITSTGVNGIWRVQYFNSTDQLILDTLEVIAVPQVACAAREDLEDSAERLAEIHEAMSA